MRNEGDDKLTTHYEAKLARVIAIWRPDAIKGVSTYRDFAALLGIPVMPHSRWVVDIDSPKVRGFLDLLDTPYCLPLLKAIEARKRTDA